MPLSTDGQTVLAEGLSGTRAYSWHTLSLTVEVSDFNVLKVLLLWHKESLFLIDCMYSLLFSRVHCQYFSSLTVSG